MRQPSRVTANSGNAYHGKRWLNGIGQVQQSFGFQITFRWLPRGVVLVGVEGAVQFVGIIEVVQDLGGGTGGKRAGGWPLVVGRSLVRKDQPQRPLRFARRW
jgi:hypothetical protein